MASMQIRKAILEDVEKIAALEAIEMPVPWSLQSIKESVQSDNSIFFVACDADELLGFAVVYYTIPEAELPDIVVSSSARRQHVATELLQTIIGEIISKGAKELFLEVRESNEPAISLYSKFGFEQISIRKNFYRNPDENALCLKLDLELYTK